jgi:TRAP-type C4-dicarboxylate transport system permease small subunit
MQLKTKKRLVRVGATAAAWSLPLFALAQVNTLGLDTVNTDLGQANLGETVGSLINIFIGILGIIAVIIVLIGGFTWMTAAGEQGKIDSAKGMLKSGVIGLAIILSAYAITNFVITQLTDATNTGS